MTSSAVELPKEAEATGRGRRVGLPVALTAGYLGAAAGLIALRALVERLDFLSVGWLLLLAAVPLLPWLVPALAPLATRAAPYVRTVKLPGGIEIALSGATSPVSGLGTVENVLTADHLAHGLTATAMPFSTTDAMQVIDGITVVRATGAEAVTVDLGTGLKWRLPNLYFLGWLLANDPVVRWIVFVEERPGTSSAFVGICGAGALVRGIESVHPSYATLGLVFHDPTRLENQQALSDEFNKIRSGVAPAMAGEVPTLAWVGSAAVRELLGPNLTTSSIRWGEQLDRQGLELVLRGEVPYVAATAADGRFRGLVEQREVALRFARRVLESA